MQGLSTLPNPLILVSWSAMVYHSLGAGHAWYVVPRFEELQISGFWGKPLFVFHQISKGHESCTIHCAASTVRVATVDGGIHEYAPVRFQITHPIEKLSVSQGRIALGSRTKELTTMFTVVDLFDSYCWTREWSMAYWILLQQLTRPSPALP